MLLMTNGDGSACTALAQGSFSFHFFSLYLSVSSSRQADAHPRFFPARREKGWIFCFIFKQLRRKIATAMDLSACAASWHAYEHTCMLLLRCLQSLQAEKFYSTDENVAKPPYIMPKKNKQQNDKTFEAKLGQRATPCCAAK